MRGLSKSPSTHRTERTLEILQYRWIISSACIGLLTGFILWAFHGLHIDGVVEQERYFTMACLSLLAYAPTVLTIIGIFTPMKSDLAQNASAPTVRHLRKLYMCLVTRGTNPETVSRSCVQMRELMQIDPRVQLTIVTDEPNDKLFLDLGVNVVATPISYRPKKARYKARALEWFRIQAQLHDDDWILHLDEETVVDEHCMKTCIQFIEKQDDFAYGQGIILYNAYNFQANPLTAIGDIARSRDDYGKYLVSHNYAHLPFVGIHGSFLLTSSKVENAIGWETESAAEDMWFGLEAWKLGFKIGWVPSIVREQSPQTISDFQKQRSRWFSGMSRLPGFFSKMTVLLWCFETVNTPLTIIFWHLMRLPYWAYFLVVLFNVVEIYSLTFACILQDIDAGSGFRLTVLRALIDPPRAWVGKWLESFIIISTILKPPKGFYVISK